MSPKVEFRTSNKTIEWDDSFENLLELAEQNGVVIDNQCGQGYCGTCKVKLLSGKVSMEATDGLDNEDIRQNMILPCVAAPETDVIIEA